MNLSGTIEVYCMFYATTPELAVPTAQNFAKITRANLVRSFVKKYNQLFAMNQAAKSRELTRFLNAFLLQIEKMNLCTEKTEHFSDSLQEHLANLQNHAQYAEIKELFDQCIDEIQKEIRDSQERDRGQTQNKIAKIKNNAVYTASIPTIGIIAGAVLTAFFPVGTLVLVAAAALLVLSEAIYWAFNYHPLSQCQTKLKGAEFETDYGQGYAVPPEELPKRPVKIQPQQNIKTAKPVLISPEADQIMNNAAQLGAEIVELGTELVTDLSTVAYQKAQKASDSIYTIWSNLQGQGAGTQALTFGKLHTL
jgi:hypothetical protein